MPRAIPPALLAAGLLATLLVSAQAHEPRPVGDGRITDRPRTGWIYSCRLRFSQNAPGAHRTGPWLQNGVFNPELKIAVESAVDWPNARLDIRREGNVRIVRANNLPLHPTGIFPISRNDPAYAYDRNPGRVRPQDILLRLPAEPRAAAQPSCLPMGMIGIMLTGGALYNALDARGNDAAAHEILDRCGGHPQQEGQYHYHEASACQSLDRDNSGHGVLVGYALDGFGIFAPDERPGLVHETASLDDCHGHVGPMTWDGERREMYHYHLTAEYPYTLGCFRGTPIRGASGLGGGARPPRLSSGRPDPVAAVASELGLDADVLRRLVGPPPPDIRRAAAEMDIDPDLLREAFHRHRPR